MQLCPLTLLAPRSASGIKDRLERVKFMTAEMTKLQYFPEWIEASEKNKKLVEKRIEAVLAVP